MPLQWVIRLKIYRPYGPKHSKWISNCEKDSIGGLELEMVDNLTITKSYKDYRVLKNLGYHVVWLQGEQIIPNTYILEILLASVRKRVTILYDNDKAGIEGSKKIKKCNSTIK
jgi:hypothetical protein